MTKLDAAKPAIEPATTTAASPAAAAAQPSSFSLDYAPALESASIANLQDSYGLFIDGQFQEPGPQMWPTLNPATGQQLAEFTAADRDGVDQAIKAAQRAYHEVWGVMATSERAKYCHRIARLLAERAREFAVLETLDGGKPIKESRDVDVPLAVAHFTYYAGWADKLDYAFVGVSAGCHPRPVGVVGAVIPWNFPLLMAAWKLAPALAGGNTVVLKPAETTPLTALLLGEVLQDAGLPPGVVNIVTGGPETGAELVAHPGLDKVAFTGSTSVGKQIQRELAGRPVRLTLELGGKAANIVFEDAAIDQCVEGIINGIYFNQGQVCCAGSRLLVQESVAELVIEKLKRRLASLRVGDPLDKNTDLGAINSAAQLEKIDSLVAAGVAEGAELYQPDCELPEQGYFCKPAIFTQVSPAHRIATEEIFGPVLSVLTFRTAEEAVEKANHTAYGLSAGIWTEKGSRILWLAEQLRAGVVWANTFNRFDPASPFGGYKESGFGREGGRQGLAAYLDLNGSVAGNTTTLATEMAGDPPDNTTADADAETTTATPAEPTATERTAVLKTYKLYIGGQFPRSESGRSYPVHSPQGKLLAHAVRASRKDLREAVKAARAAQPAWARRTAYNRGQILYRIAELMESRRAEFARELQAAGSEPELASQEVNLAIDRWIWYAGWCDKFAAVSGSSNPVAGPYFGFTIPEPTGVVGLVATDEAPLLGLVSRLAPALTGGNTVVALASQSQPLAAVALGEVLATSDVPAGVVNILTGWREELVEPLAGHGDVNAIDITGCEPELAAQAQVLTAENVMRVVAATVAERNWLSASAQSPYLIEAFSEYKTVWHPKGS